MTRAHEAGRAPTIDDLFVCVGAQKAGTTWLARVLASHPELFVTPVKEIHYFDHLAGITKHLSDKKRRSRYRKYHQRLWTQPHRISQHMGHWGWYRRYMANPIDDDWYRGLFAERGGKRFAGEATPEYAIIGRDGFSHLRRLAPGVRVLFILRNPVARAWSQALHHCRASGLDATRQSPEALEILLASGRFAELGNYMATLDDLEACFEPGQVSVLFYEDIHADRLAALERICDFIGLSFSSAWFPELGRRYNRSQEVSLPAGLRAHLAAQYRPLASAIADRLGRVPDSWAREMAI
ncbi:MAG: hypothetical protein GC150_02575 [Rhizobiales bacterium]|nr:hypothetical protein [Hyphomicrobiales bacterium]